MTLPDPRWPDAEQEAYMRSWYPAMMSDVSVHEVYPGHYVQFLYAKNFPSHVRKVFGANTNIEGWAHCDEQMSLTSPMSLGARQSFELPHHSRDCASRTVRDDALSSVKAPIARRLALE